MSTLTFKNVTKRFGRSVVAVKNFSLHVHDGEFLVLLGPSGCGKTTAMRMVAGLEEVTEGTILIDDEDITDLPPRRRNVSMVFQNYAVWPHMTVYDNIAYALKLRRMPKVEMDRTVKEVSEMTKISELLERYPSQLSGGQQQRVAVARALASKPKFVLADEPTANLDSKSTATLLEIMEQLNRDEGITFIFSTHDARVVKKARRVITLEDGKVISDENKRN